MIATQQILEKMRLLGWDVFLHPLNSSDLQSPDFHLFQS